MLLAVFKKNFLTLFAFENVIVHKVMHVIFTSLNDSGAWTLCVRVLALLLTCVYGALLPARIHVCLRWQPKDGSRPFPRIKELNYLLLKNQWHRDRSYISATPGTCGLYQHN